MKTMELKNNVVKLRPMQKEDINGIFEVAAFSEIWTYMSISVDCKEDVEKYVNQALSLKETGTELPFVIIDAKTDRIIGSTKLMDIHTGHQRGEIGFTWLTPQYWKTAVNTNCKYLLLSYCFEVLGWQRVQIKTDHENIRSQNAIERIGAKKEGVLRNHMIRKDGTTRHTVMFSVTKEEWPETKRYMEKLLNK
ncbi:GNAT family N-acetyltransferase [Lysinibacillus antri]|uniref:N-acetyltransferase n=1 Tax=Lysinibacillus antri TaxID=2498145 RepID=A0A432LIM1_9BACI|nr:GNAT family protein [Lysinibacillus antri]RUL56893.1 N-acetyltransferase [Lysinibacillus antri]